MKSLFLAIICLFSIISCKNKTDKQPQENNITEAFSYTSFGKEIIADDAIPATSMASHYQTMNVGDRIPSKIKAKVNSVCQAKGCWMRLDLEDGNEVMVKFKDYGFFMPKDITGQEVVINGNAYVTEVSVNEQRHYAEDAGKTTEEIALIIEPKRTFSFEADGVLLKQ